MMLSVHIKDLKHDRNDDENQPKQQPESYFLLRILKTMDNSNEYLYMF